MMMRALVLGLLGETPDKNERRVLTACACLRFVVLPCWDWMTKMVMQRWKNGAYLKGRRHCGRRLV